MRSNPKDATRIKELELEVEGLQDLITNYGRFLNRAVPSIQSLLGDKVKMIGTTSDYQGAIFATKDGVVKVTVLPPTRTFLIEGVNEDTGVVPFPVTLTKSGKLDRTQMRDIVATVTAIRAVTAGQPNPLASEELEVLGYATT
jgi:hypothetical protein